MTPSRLRTLRLLCGAGLTALMFSGAQANAQTAPAEAHELPEVIVTATFRNKSIEHLSSNATVFQAQDVAGRNIRSTADFVALTPNMTFDNTFTYNNSYTNIRGVMQLNNGDAPLAVIIDGVPQNNQKQFNMPLFDIEQIEVLRGPQGSLFGRNAVGGAVNIVTRAPGKSWSGFAEAGAGNGGLYRVTAAAGGPLSDKASLRLAGTALTSDGLIDNAYLGRPADYVDHDWAVRGRLDLQPTPWLKVDLRGQHQDYRGGAGYYVVTRSYLNPAFRDGGPNDRHQPAQNIRGLGYGSTSDVSLKLAMDTALGELTAISAYTRLRETYLDDYDMSNPGQPTFGPLGQLGVGQRLRVGLASQEIRLASPTDQSLRYIVGAFYLRTDRALLTRAYVDLDGSTGQFFDPARTFLELNEDNDNKAWAVFGNLEYDLSAATRLELGLRYDKDTRHQLVLTPKSPAYGTTRSASFEAVQPKVAVNHELTEDLTAYATVGTGFRSGGFNAPGSIVDIFKDEYLVNYEAGLKGRYLNGQGRFSIAAFHARTRDYQFFFIANGSQVLANLDRTTTTGAEAETTIEAGHGFRLTASLGLLDTSIKDVGDGLSNFLKQSGIDPASLKGRKTSFTTPVTAALGVSYERRLGEEINLTASADYAYQGDRYWEIDNRAVRDPVGLLSGRVTLERGGWSLALWGKNLTNEFYYKEFESSRFLGSPNDAGFPGKPRTFGVDLKKSW